MSCLDNWICSFAGDLAEVVVVTGETHIATFTPASTSGILDEPMVCAISYHNNLMISRSWAGTVEDTAAIMLNVGGIDGNSNRTMVSNCFCQGILIARHPHNPWDFGTNCIASEVTTAIPCFIGISLLRIQTSVISRELCWSKIYMFYRDVSSLT